MEKKKKKKAKYYTRALVMTSVDEASSIEPGLIYPSSAGDQLIPMSRLTTKVGGVEMPFAEAATTPVSQPGKDGKTIEGLPPFAETSSRVETAPPGSMVVRMTAPVTPP